MAHPSTGTVQHGGTVRPASRSGRTRALRLGLLTPLFARATQDVLAQLDQPVALLAQDDSIVFANGSFVATFGLSAGDEGQSLFEVAGGAFDDRSLRGRLDAVRDGGRVHGWPFVRSFPGAGRKVLSIDLVALRGAFFDTGMTVLSVRDETARASLESDVARRAQEEAALAARLGRLRAADTPAVTAERIIHEMQGLPGFDYLVLGTFGIDERLVPLALEVPPGTPLAAGRALPDARSRYLRARAVTGPWLETWQVRPDDGDYGTRLAASGLRAVAYAPIHGPTSLIGLLMMGTSSPRTAERIGDQLPALLSFAAIAGALLGQAQERHNQETAARIELTSIIEERAFEPVFQPVVELVTERIVGYEALTRFADGRSPAERFAHASSLGLATQLELACLCRALEAASTSMPDAWIGLNVSPALVLESDQLRGILAGADREIVLEITEHAPVPDHAELHRAIAALGRHVRVAVDDAGAGYSGLQRIIELGPDLIKLDMTLVRGIESDRARQALVAGMVHFARQTGSTLLAEGIETTAEAVALQDLGIALGQGYLYGRPASLS